MYPAFLSSEFCEAGFKFFIMNEVIKVVAQYLYVPVILGALLFAVIFYRKRLIELGLATLFIGGLSYLLSKVGAQLISDPRPFIQTGIAPLIPGALDNGFPSDHTLLVAAVGGILFYFNWKAGLVVWFLALLIGLARVYAGVHHLLDIAGSLVIVLAVTALFILGRQLWQKNGLSRRTSQANQGASEPR
ncbi:MAG: hypothetical protein BGO39_14005 [Chloroflexi bacterium 54-19]|nr:MAG: hypothetical protein BGO39_14005 [Chloroflexi bacterium 54-19]